MRHLFVIGFAAFCLSGCGRAIAASADSGNDYHCSLLISHLHDSAVRIGSPASETLALRDIRHWYAERLREERVAEPRLPSLGAEGEAILAAAKRNPQSARDAIMGCTERAVLDPAFEAWKRGRH